MAIMLYPDGTNAVVSPENGRYFTLAEKRRLVPGNRHEIIFFSERWSMLVCPDGGSAYNESATRWLGALTDAERMVFGPAMLFRNEEFTTDLTDGAFMAKIALERMGMI